MKRLWNRITHGRDPATLKSLGDLVAGFAFALVIIIAFLLGSLV